MQTFNFRGLPGTKVFPFDDLMVILQKNAAGKSSFIDALVYVLSGVKPEGDMIHADADQCGVQITFEDGTKYSRICPRTGNVVYRAGNGKTKKVTKTEFEASLARTLGVRASAVQVVTSSDVVRSMKPSELSDFFLQYIGEKLTLADLEADINDGTLTDDMKDMLRKVAAKVNLPNKFGINWVDILHKEFYDYRRKYSKEESDAEAYYKVLRAESDGIPDGADRDALLEEKAVLEKEREKIAAYQAERRAYEQAMRRYETDKSTVSALEKQISMLPDLKGMSEAACEEKQNDISRRIENARKFWSTANQTVVSLQTSVTTLEKAYKELDSPTCPLSEKLTCTTDKTVVRQEMGSAIESLNEQIEIQRKICIQHREEEDRLSKEADELDRVMAALAKKKILEDQLEAAKKNCGDEPKAPEKPSVQDVSRIDIINSVLSKMDKRVQAEKYQVIKDRKNRYASAFSGLVKAFAPKGIVRENIMRDYLKALEEACNKTAEKLRPGISFRFESDNGVYISVDMNGDGTYLGYWSLSGGERGVMLLILMSMLNDLTGFPIIIMDEMSVLDADTFGAVVGLLDDTKDSRSHAIIASVNHTDTVKAVEDRQVTLYKI